MIHVFYKASGETMTECMQRMKESEHLDPTIPVTYTGRLDPAASGAIVFLSGSDRYNKDQFQSLDKIYAVTILLGVKTDTADLLGVVSNAKTPDNIVSTEQIQDICTKLCSSITEPFPAFSARRVDGKALWMHTKSNTTNKVAENLAPIHTTEIYTISALGTQTISGRELKDSVSRICTLLSGHDFRQPEIIKSWEQVSDETEYQTIQIRVHCSSGSYMRTLAERFGALVDSPALAMTIVRESVGEFSIPNL